MHDDDMMMTCRGGGLACLLRRPCDHRPRHVHCVRRLQEWRGRHTDGCGRRRVWRHEPVVREDGAMAHNGDPVEEGRVYLYFFPNGWVESSVIHLSDDDEKSIFALKVQPLTGKVKVSEGYYNASQQS